MPPIFYYFPPVLSSEKTRGHGNISDGENLYQNPFGSIKAENENKIYKVLEDTFLPEKFGNSWIKSTGIPLVFNGYKVYPDYRAWKGNNPVFIEVKNWDVHNDAVIQSMKYIITLDRVFGYKKYEFYIIVGCISKPRRKILEDMGAIIVLHSDYIDEGRV